MAVDTGAAPSDTTEDIQAENDRLKAKLAAEISSREKLEVKRTELLTEAKRNKRLTRLIEAAG